jgi:hypothetical protein
MRPWVAPFESAGNLDVAVASEHARYTTDLIGTQRACGTNEETSRTRQYPLLPAELAFAADHDVKPAILAP